jgi:hypothetical protein
MRIIEVRSSKRFKGAWVAFEDPGVHPAFATGTPKADALGYAKNRFRGGGGELHVYSDDGESIIERIVIADRGESPAQNERLPRGPCRMDSVRIPLSGSVCESRHRESGVECRSQRRLPRFTD